ncbi:MAG: iron ABC transporter permease [Proteobacteria bacterium]|nr:iron ABC transporter permease [Pseudomonadota bacterium]
MIAAILAPRLRFPLAVGTIAVLFLGLFLLYPLFSVFQASFLDPAGAPTLANYARMLTRPLFYRSLANSLTVALWATVATVAIGVPLAVCLARLAVPGKTALLALAALPLVLPSFVGAYALVLLLGRAGIVTTALQSLGVPFGSIYGMPGLVLTYTLTLFPYVVLPTLAALKAVDVSIEEAGQNLGAARARVLFTVTLPVVLPSILAGALLVFMEALENFGVPFVLAEDMPVLSVQAYKLFVGEVGANPASAGVLAVMLVACTTGALLLQRTYIARRRYATQARAAPPEWPARRGLRLGAALYCWGVVLFALVPFGAVIVLSFVRFRGPVSTGELGFDNFVLLFARSPEPLFNTILLASGAAAGATLLGVPIGYVLTRTRSSLTHLLDVLAMVPFAVAGTVLGIGLVIAFNSGFLVLTGGGLILVLAYMVRKLPFSVRASSAILHQIDPSLEEASINLGVSPLRTFFGLTVPLMLGGIVGGAILTWVTIASELSATVVLYSAPWATMTVVMFQALEGTSAGAAAAAATVLVVVAVVPIALVYRLLRRHQAALM